MKAYQFSSGGTIDTLELVDVPTPRPGPGEVLLRMRAASLNYRDLLVVNGRYPRSHQARIIPLSDAAGAGVECGEGGSRARKTAVSGKSVSMRVSSGGARY